MEWIYCFEIVFVSLLLFVPKIVEHNYRHHLSAREEMIVKFAQYQTYPFLSFIVFILAAFGAHFYPKDAWLFFLIFFVSAFCFYIYRYALSYIIYQKEHFPRRYLIITLIQPVAFLLAIISVGVVVCITNYA